MRFWIIFLAVIPLCSPFLWTLFGNNGCNCCQCAQSFTNSLFTETTYKPQNSFQWFSQPPTPIAPQHNSFAYSQGLHYVENVPLVTSTSSYRGPPSASPISAEQLQQSDLSYSTDQVTFTGTIPNVVDNGDVALSQLENELAEEKYKYNLQKAKEKSANHRQNRIRVFKIKPHKPSVHTGVVEWQPSQVAKYTNEKAVNKFLEASESTDNELEEFIPIEIGTEPELVAEEPAGPPPNVRNRISHDPIFVLRRRFVAS